MNTAKKSIFTVLACAALMLAAQPASASHGEFNYEQALPIKKSPLPVSLRRNPFHIAGERDRPVAVFHDKDDPAAKLPSLLTPHIRSVFHRPRPLLLVDTTVIQPGDEIHFSKSEALEKYRIVLRAIEPDRLIFHLTALDSQQGGQVECVVPLPGDMRKDQ